MVNADDVHSRQGEAQSLQPPDITGGLVRVPAVERIAPQLPGGREVIGRDARHDRRPAVGVEEEQVGVRPNVGGVHRHENGRVADDAQSLLVGVAAQGVPLAEEDKSSTKCWGCS